MNVAGAVNTQALVREFFRAGGEWSAADVRRYLLPRKSLDAVRGQIADLATAGEVEPTQTTRWRFAGGHR